MGGNNGVVHGCPEVPLIELCTYWVTVACCVTCAIPAVPEERGTTSPLHDTVPHSHSHILSSLLHLSDFPYKLPILPSNSHLFKIRDNLPISHKHPTWLLDNLLTHTRPRTKMSPASRPRSTSSTASSNPRNMAS